VRFGLPTLVLAGALTAVSAQAPDRSRAEDLARKASERIRALQREADELAARERSVLADLEQLERERQLQLTELKDLDRQVALTEADVEATDRRIAELETTAETERPAIEARLVDLYKLGRAGYLRLLLSVEDFRALGRAYRMVSALARLDRLRVDAHRETLEALRAARGELTERRERAVGLQAESTRAREALEAAIASRTRLVARLDERRDLNAQFSGELQQAHERLQAALATMAAGGTTGPTGLPLEPFMGDLPWPLRGRVVSRFGTDRHPRLGTAVARNGVEIGVAEGQPVRVVHDGQVAFGAAFVGFGNLVIVDHGAQAYSLYGYLSSLAVGEGARVQEGEVVGYTGRAPAGEPALYFELRIDGKPVDPVQWLKP
jgi:septal ring factor EnvC (AmiA/AmiB activator)